MPLVVGDDAIYYVTPAERRGVKDPEEESRIEAWGWITALNLEDGILNNIADYRFKDESPTSLILIDGDLFLNSSYNFAGFDSGGRHLYQRYYKAPGPSNWAKAVAIILDSLAVYSRRHDADLGLNSETFEYVRETWAKLYGTAVDTRRFSYTHIEAEKWLKNDDQKFALVQFDKYTGEEVGRLWLNKRTPEFAVDPFMQTVFWKSSKKVIQALQFESVMDFEVEEADESPAYVFFYSTKGDGPNRPRVMLKRGGLNVFMDSRDLLSLDRGQYVGLEVRPGSHLFTSYAKARVGDKVVSIEIEPGNYYCINVDMGMDVNDTELKLETVEKCGKEIPKLKPAGGVAPGLTRVYEWPELTP